MKFYKEEKQAIRDLLKLGLGFHILKFKEFKHDVCVEEDGIMFFNGIDMSAGEENKCYSLMINFYTKYKQEQITTN